RRRARPRDLWKSLQAVRHLLEWHAVGVADRTADPAVHAAIDDELRHHRASVADVAGEPGMPFPAKAVYPAMRSAYRPAPGSRAVRWEGVRRLRETLDGSDGASGQGL